MNNNPLLIEHGCVDFSLLQTEHIVPAVKETINNCTQIIENIAQGENHSYNTLVCKLDEISLKIDRLWSPVTILNFLANSSEIRVAYNEGRKLLTQFETTLRSNSLIYNHLEKLSKELLSVEQKTVLENYVRDFRLHGASLEEKQKEKYKNIVLELSNLQSTFGENVLDSTGEFQLLVTDENELNGLPQSIKTSLKEEAAKNDMQGFLCTLQMPVVNAILKYVDNEDIRRQIHMAYSKRGLSKGKDNRPLIKEILELRSELASLLGFKTYAHLSLAKKTAESPEKVLEFLYSLEEKTRQPAKKEFEDLAQFKKETDGGDLKAWDYSFYLEKLRKKQLDFSEEDLRPYFSIDSVLKGLFEIVDKIYEVQVKEIEPRKCWHPEVRYFQAHSAGEILGEFFLDYHPRKTKRSGAWMQDVVGRSRTKDGFEMPIGLIGGNATRATEDTPALLNHREVVTLFHEFGHMSQFLFTKCNEYSVAGINGVPWDVVELPSQFLENWAWDKEALKMFARHHKTGEVIPDDLCDKLIASRNFHSATVLRRQLEFSLLDMHLHFDYDGTPLFEFSEQIHNKLSFFPMLPDTLFLAAFNHIFAGGYSAGYFSYKWAEVWEADAFELFKEKGIFNPEVGRSFRQNILEKGGSENPFVLFERFRGRRPQQDALLKKYDIAN
ncbi:M3 family metallopeptidase [Candidatus Uabimicrobium sp. HlEnr_7]|uniref:M3 family metallopeptidase n=1 Tax=Candidatus Uabimicrobium helgolandensis TaxID=3095367 RepID=UPI003555DF5A